jgi:transcriptional regulator with XRE-family HTH domain
MPSGTIGKRVRDLRKERGWDQGELARRTDLSRNTISRIELGHHLPASTTVEKLAWALGVDPGDLFPKPTSLKEFDVDAFLMEVITEERPETLREMYELAHERFTERFKNMPKPMLRAYAENLKNKQRSLRNDPDNLPDNLTELIEVMEKRHFIAIALKAAERELAGDRG